MFDDRWNCHGLDRRGVGVERIDLDVESGIGGGEDAVSATLVTVDPVLPASRRDPEAVDEDDRVGNLGHVVCSLS
jgi:hypothetical protein